MTDEVKDTQAEEVKPATEPTVETKETPKEEPAKETPEEEKPVSEMMEQEEVKPNLIPEAVFLIEKKARKNAEKELKALKKSIEDGASQEDISSDIEEIAEEHNIDKAFLNKLAKTIKAQAEEELDKKYSSKFDAKEKAENFDNAFKKAFDTAIERAPDFKDIASAETIKTLALAPENRKKTISTILEETYGSALSGKRTIEKTKPGGGKDPEPLDVARASKDIEYFKEVMADPKKKAQYNEQMLKKGF
jgi:hypothetical protein